MTMTVRLYSHDEHYVVTAELGDQTTLPDVLLWNERVFHLKLRVDPRTGALRPFYTEACAVTVTETFVEDYLL